MSSDRPDVWDLIDLAHMIAKVAHSGQTRRDTEPYFNHCNRVAWASWEETGSYVAVQAGYLHDTIEDTHITQSTLRDIGFTPEVVHCIGTLTRQPGTQYADYITNIVKHGTKDALAVKLADLNDNLRDLEETSGGLRRRYLTAKELIVAEQKRRGNCRTAAVEIPRIHAVTEAQIA